MDLCLIFNLTDAVPEGDARYILRVSTSIFPRNPCNIRVDISIYYSKLIGSERLILRMY